LERAAERAEMATSNLSQLETGKTGVSDENLSALAHAYDCEVGDLFRDPTRPDYELWRIIVGMKSDDRERVLKMVKALAEVA
jgi:transcriptional regulator with XRE-family HTH domain